MRINPELLLDEIYSSYINNEDSSAISKNLDLLEKTIIRAKYINNVLEICQVMKSDLKDAIIDYRDKYKNLSHDNILLRFSHEEDAFNSFDIKLSFDCLRFSLASEKINNIKDKIIGVQKNNLQYSKKFNKFVIETKSEEINTENICEQMLKHMLDKDEYSQYKKCLMDKKIKSSQDIEPINKRNKI